LYPKDSVPAASSYTLKVNIKGEKAEASDESMFQKYTYRDLPGGSGFEKAAEIKLNEFITESIYMKETRFYKLPIKKGTVKINVSAVTRKPWYQAMNSVINMTYTLKICDEDWAEIASQSLTVGDNPSEPFSISAVVEVGTNEELYISLSSSENHGNLGQKDLVDIYPEGFRPDATKFTILAVEE
jgi:hypothetical protein